MAKKEPAAEESAKNNAPDPNAPTSGAGDGGAASVNDNASDSSHEMSAARIAALEKELADSQKVLSETKGELSEANKQNLELMERLSTAEKLMDGSKTVVSQGKSKFTVEAESVMWNHERVAAADVHKHPELINFLLEKKSPILKPL